jgi:hypothetical protein
MRIRYALPFVSKRTGERRTIVVSLAQHEVADVLYHRALRRNGAGGIGGPLEKMYAWHRAARAAPEEEFTPIYEQARRLELSSVNE